jgi:maltoporin
MLDIRPATVEFGDVALGKESSAAVRLQNDGIADLAITELAQFDDAAFEVRGLPVTLRPGASATVTIRYRPPELGTHQRTLALSTDSPDLPRADLAIHGHAVRGLATWS